MKCPHCLKPLPPRRIGRPPKQPNEAGQWLCPCCGRYLEPDEFGKHWKSANGLDSWCRDCRRKQGGL